MPAGAPTTTDPHTTPLMLVTPPELSGEDTDVEERQLSAVPKPKWFTPLRLLIIFCLANVMVYLDRGMRSRTVSSATSRVREPAGSRHEQETTRTRRSRRAAELTHPLLSMSSGAIGSNGVNGSPRTAENPKGSGIQVR
jgi:hypothetical protein